MKDKSYILHQSSSLCENFELRIVGVGLYVNPHLKFSLCWREDGKQVATVHVGKNGREQYMDINDLRYVMVQYSKILLIAEQMEAGSLNRSDVVEYVSSLFGYPVKEG